LSHFIAKASSIKIEWISLALCDISIETLEYVTIDDIKSVIQSCEDSQVDESYYDTVSRYFSHACPICGDTFPASQMESMLLCSDQCCRMCTKTYYRTAILGLNDSTVLNSLTCFERHPVPNDASERMCFFQLLDAKVG
jgi:hypothetical protein